MHLEAIACSARVYLFNKIFWIVISHCNLLSNLRGDLVDMMKWIHDVCSRRCRKKTRMLATRISLDGLLKEVSLCLYFLLIQMFDSWYVQGLCVNLSYPQFSTRILQVNGSKSGDDATFFWKEISFTLPKGPRSVPYIYHCYFMNVQVNLSALSTPTACSAWRGRFVQVPDCQICGRKDQQEVFFGTLRSSFLLLLKPPIVVQPGTVSRLRQRVRPSLCLLGQIKRRMNGLAPLGGLWCMISWQTLQNTHPPTPHSSEPLWGTPTPTKIPYTTTTIPKVSPHMRVTRYANWSENHFDRLQLYCILLVFGHPQNIVLTFRLIFNEFEIHIHEYLIGLGESCVDSQSSQCTC